MGVRIRAGQEHTGGSVTPAVVADRFDELVTTSGRLEQELRVLASAAVPCSQATVDRLAHLLTCMRPAASARTLLAGIDTGLLLDGVALWIRRQDGSGAQADAVRRLRAVNPA